MKPARVTKPQSNSTSSPGLEKSKTPTVSALEELPTRPSITKCSCTESIQDASTSRIKCPLQDVEYMLNLPTDRPKLACIPSDSAIKSLPPFLLGEKVVLYGGMAVRANDQTADRCVVTVFDHSKYAQDGTFSVQTDNGSIIHGISGLRLEPLGTKSCETPRYVDVFVHKMGHVGKGLNLRELSACPPKQFEEQQLIRMVEKYSKLIRLNYETNRNMAVVLSRRATLFAALGHFKESLDDTERAIQLEPRYTVAYYRKGYALCSLGRFAEACVEFRKVQSSFSAILVLLISARAWSSIQAALVFAMHWTLR
ncbi:hypothetical protein AC1031_009159 [Aphanomyces cochlioides]|nr:hypothetical protein AC1031_009159 [Aphanomyces cochlioides]